VHRAVDQVARVSACHLLPAATVWTLDTAVELLSKSMRPRSSCCNILIYVQQDATLHSLFCLETALHVSGGTVTHHQKRKHLYLQHLVFVTPLLLSAAIVEELELV